jgi:hypothetical protein
VAGHVNQLVGAGPSGLLYLPHHYLGSLLVHYVFCVCVAGRVNQLVGAGLSRLLYLPQKTYLTTI